MLFVEKQKTAGGGLRREKISCGKDGLCSPGNRRASRHPGGYEAADHYEKQGSCTVGVDHNGGIISQGMEMAYNFEAPFCFVRLGEII